MKFVGSLFPALVTALFMTVGANATIVVTSGTDIGANSTDPRPNSNAAAASFDSSNNETIYTFETAPLGSFASLNVAPGVTMTSTTASILNTPVGNPDRLFGYNTTAGGSRFVSLLGGSLTFIFDTPVEDFGFYITGVQLDSETITFNDGAPQSIPIPNPGIGNGGVSFIGFTDFGNPISSITINVAGDVVGIDDVRVSYGVPEPATLMLVCSAIALMGLSRRRKSI
jgi:hypothetical protein